MPCDHQTIPHASLKTKYFTVNLVELTEQHCQPVMIQLWINELIISSINWLIMPPRVVTHSDTFTVLVLSTWFKLN